jgi:hypothetical protein
MHGSKPVHLTVFAVNPYEIHSGGTGDLRHRAVGKRHAATVCDLTAPGLVKKTLQIVYVHYQHLQSLLLPAILAQPIMKRNNAASTVVNVKMSPVAH